MSLVIASKVRRCRLPIALLTLACSCGCGTKDRATYPVSGKVVFDNGAPLAGGMVMFESEPAGSEPRYSSAGVIAADGTFQLSTFKEGDGAVAGKHRALVRVKRAGDAEKPGAHAESPIASKFENFDTSGLTFTVEPGNNDLKIVVKHPQG
jgi:hypothetical protein